MSHGGTERLRTWAGDEVAWWDPAHGLIRAPTYGSGRPLRGDEFSSAAVAFGSVVPVRAMRKQSPTPRAASSMAYDSFTSHSGRSWQRRSQCPTAASWQSA